MNPLPERGKQGGGSGLGQVDRDDNTVDAYRTKHLPGFASPSTTQNDNGKRRKRKFCFTRTFPWFKRRKCSSPKQDENEVDEDTGVVMDGGISQGLGRRTLEHLPKLNKANPSDYENSIENFIGVQRGRNTAEKHLYTQTQHWETNSTLTKDQVTKDLRSPAEAPEEPRRRRRRRDKLKERFRSRKLKRKLNLKKLKVQDGVLNQLSLNTIQSTSDGDVRRKRNIFKSKAPVSPFPPTLKTVKSEPQIEPNTSTEESGKYVGIGMFLCLILATAVFFAVMYAYPYSLRDNDYAPSTSYTLTLEIISTVLLCVCACVVLGVLKGKVSVLTELCIGVIFFLLNTSTIRFLTQYLRDYKTTQRSWWLVCLVAPFVALTSITSFVSLRKLNYS